MHSETFIIGSQKLSRQDILHNFIKKNPGQSCSEITKHLKIFDEATVNKLIHKLLSFGKIEMRLSQRYPYKRYYIKTAGGC
jgi:predicted transcriptional regulator